MSPDAISQVDGAIILKAGLHHGDRLNLGPWILIYQRDEWAEHGRFDGGREGGDPSGPTLLGGEGGQESEPSDSGPIE